MSIFKTYDKVVELEKQAEEKNKRELKRREEFIYRLNKSKNNSTKLFNLTVKKEE